MKQFQWIVVIVLLGLMSACDVRDLAASQTSVALPSLSTADEYLRRGDNFAAANDYRHAILDYDEAIRLNPAYAEAYNNRGYAYHWSGNADRAIADYSQAIELRPNYAYAFNNRGAAYMASGHPSQAISDFDRALALQPDLSQAYINRGNAYLRLGRFDLALADFRLGSANPVRTLALLCGTPIITVLLAAFIMHLLESRPRSRGNDASL